MCLRAAWAGACSVWMCCVRVSMCARAAAPSGMWQLLAPGVRRCWLRVRLCSRTVSGSLLPVHYTSEHRSSAVAAAVAARVTGQEGLGDTQLVERGTITNDLGCQGAIRLALI